MDEAWIPIIIVPIVIIGLPWLILHYVTKWKTRTSLTAEDETMLDDLYDLARRLDDRMLTLERILHDENPNWNPLAAERGRPLLEERSELDALETELRARRAKGSGGRKPDLVKRERA